MSLKSAELHQQDTTHPAGSLARSRFRLSEDACLDCCASDIATPLERLPGVDAVQVLTTSGLVVVDHDRQLTAETLRRQAAALGVSLLPVQRHRPDPGPPWWRQPRSSALAAASVSLLVGLVADKVLDLGGWPIACYLATLLVAGFHPARTLWRSLRAGRPTISILLLAAFGAVGLGLYEEAAVLVVVYSLGQILEDYAGDRVRGSIRALMALAPPVAQRKRADGATEAVPVEELTPGELIVVRPGERLPTDGIVATGSSVVDQSPVTGESVPVDVTIGSEVFAGTINGTGALEVRVTKPYADTTLARIIRQVEEAQASKGQAQRFADRFGAVYGPIMLLAATLVALVPPLFVGDFQDWLYRALVVLAVSCSCALLISVPVSVVAAISRGARHGILIKGGAYLEALAGVRAVAFDKTGTLTSGTPQLTDLIALDGHSPDEVLRLAASVEATSEHPLGRAIVRAVEARQLPVAAVRDTQALPGAGVCGQVDGREVFVGKPDALRGHQAVDAQAAEHVAQLEAAGKTAMVVTSDNHTVGLLAVADRLRDDAEQAVRALHQLGVGHVLMLTGDNPQVAAAIAAQVGIDDWRAGLLPEDKTSAVASLRSQHGPIAMVGDGVNDAPALATADVGIAMGAVGTDVALETADVALMADDLTKLPAAIRLARQAQTNIRQNITLSLLTVVVLVTAALAGWLSLTAGLLLNEGTALLIIANGLRLARFGEQRRPVDQPEIPEVREVRASPRARIQPDLAPPAESRHCTADSCGCR